MLGTPTCPWVWSLSREPRLSLQAPGASAVSSLVGTESELGPARHLCSASPCSLWSWPFSTLVESELGAAWGSPQSRAGGLCGALLNQTTCFWNVLWHCLPPPERCCAALENLSERKRLELSLSTPDPSASTRHTTGAQSWVCRQVGGLGSAPGDTQGVALGRSQENGVLFPQGVMMFTPLSP